MKKRVKHYQSVIESTDWENELMRQEGKIDGTCWLFIFVATVFFGMVIAGILTR